MSLIVNDVSKSYGNKKVVDDISFELKKPGVFGLLGTNGAGKTTTIRMILGILKKDKGIINWNNLEVNRENVNFGYLPEERGLYPKTKIYNQVLYFAKLKGMSKEAADKSINYWFKRLEVEEYRNMTAEKLSKGNQQKIQFLMALLHDPELIILDEPFSGLDPVNAEILKDVMKELVSKKKYIIMSSHQMSSIEEFCDYIIILNKGKTVLKGDLTDIKETYPSSEIIIETKDNIETFLEENKFILNNKKKNEYKIKIDDEKQSEKLLKILIKNDIKVTKFEVLKPNLHEIFIEKVKGGNL